MSGILKDVLERVAWSTPFFGAMAAGLWICNKYRENNPALSRLLSWFFVIFSFSSLFSISIRAWFATWATQDNIQPKIFAMNVYAFANFFHIVLDFVGWGVLLLAVFRALQPKPECPGV